MSKFRIATGALVLATALGAIGLTLGATAGVADAAEIKVVASGALKLALPQLLADFQKSSPITFVKNVKTPTLLLQGEADKTDPIGQSQQLYRALKRYGVKSDLVIYPREGHGIAEEKHQLDLLDRMVNWFDESLK